MLGLQRPTANVVVGSVASGAVDRHGGIVTVTTLAVAAAVVAAAVAAGNQIRRRTCESESDSDRASLVVQS